VRRIALALMRAWAEWGTPFDGVSPSEVGWAASPAGPLRYAVRGRPEAPPALLLHGLGDSIAGWAQVAGPLSSKLQVHLIDLPGHGLSGRPKDWRLATLADAVAVYARRLRDPILIGHSLGGWLAIRLALSGAVRPSAIALVNPGGALLSRDLWAPFRQLVSASDRAGVARYLEHAFRRPPLLLRMFPGEVSSAMSAEACSGILDALSEPDFLRDSELAMLNAPLRLLWGAHDRLLPAGTLDFFRRALPRAEVVVLEGSGHLPHLEAPRELARALLAPFPA
jgi:pyruvate dehydrogenase E2 component (dihydrolipoamide acetyltransferase)